jgi:predicted ATPase
VIVGATVKGLKRFKDERFKLAPLSVLTGLNGSGKTSLLQSVMLAVESSTTKSSSLSLNGPFGLELGTAEDVLNWESTSPIEISFETREGETAHWQFAVPSEDALYLEIVDAPSYPPKQFSGKPRMFTYLSAERLGPRGYTAASPLPEAELEVGVHGEYCAHVLSVLGDQVMKAKERTHPLYSASAPRLLKYEVEQWLSEIARPIEVTGVRSPGATVAELRFRAPGATWVRSTNMGFGISYALPIVLAGLIADTDGLLLIENPEAHLHPAGQSRMGVFLAWLAGRGVQTIVETHSDHVINGIRRAIAEHGYLHPSSAIMHWFGGEDDEDKPISTSLSIGETGSVSAWPKGFFDQYQIDVASLGRIRRRSSAT